MGASRLDGGRRARSPRGRAWHRLSEAQPGPRWLLARGTLHRHRLSSSLLPALPRLLEVLSPLGTRPLSQSDQRQHTRRPVRAVNSPRPPERLVLAVSGLAREAAIAGGPGTRALAGAGPRLEGLLDQAIAA